LESNNSYKILIIFSIVLLFTSGYILNYSENVFAAEPFQIIPKSLFHLYDNTYLFIFEGCTGMESISSKEVKIISDIETVLLIEHSEKDRVLEPEECILLKVILDALDPKSISIQVESLAFNYTINLDDLERKKIPFQREYVQMGFPTEITIRTIDLLQSDEILTEAQLQECEQHYDNFVLLKLSDFTSRYLYHKFMGDCVLLFEDPIWETGETSETGETGVTGVTGITGVTGVTEELDRYELLSQRLAELKLQQMELKAVIYKPITITPLSVIELVTDGMYLFTFEACSGDSFVNLDDAVAASDTEVISLVQRKLNSNIIPVGVCIVFEIKIMADDPDSIRVLIPDLLPPKAQIQDDAPVDQVVCREGLQLMIKNHGQTPACISESTIPKLIERGWGYILQDFDFSVESTTSSDTNSTSTESTNSTSTDLT